MPKSKHVSAYPAYYFDLFQQVESGSTYESPPLPTSQVAKIRFDLYGFRAALRNEHHYKARLWSSYKIKIVSVDESQAVLTIGEEDTNLEAVLLSTLKTPKPIEPTFTSDELGAYDFAEDDIDLVDDVLGKLGFGGD